MYAPRHRSLKITFDGWLPMRYGWRRPKRGSRAIGAVVARFVHTEEVTGSNPVSPTQVSVTFTLSKPFTSALLPDYLPDYAGPEPGANRRSMTVAPV